MASSASQGVGSRLADDQRDGAGCGLVAGELPAAGPRAATGGTGLVYSKTRGGAGDGQVAVLDRGEKESASTSKKVPSSFGRRRRVLSLMWPSDGSF